MRDDKRNYVVVGAFVIGMAVALVAWLLKIAGPGGPSDSYHVLYRNVTGLEPGARILFEGFPVGTIAKIRPLHLEGRPYFRVELDVQKGWPIPAGSEAAIVVGLFEATVINIEQGEGDGATRKLEPGSEIRAREAADLFAAAGETADKVGSLLDQLGERTPAVLENIEVVTLELRNAVTQVNAVLDHENVARVDQILANVENATGDLYGLLEDVRAAGGNLNRLMASLDRLLDEEDGDVTEALDDLRHTTAALASHIDAITANLENTLRNANEFSKQIRDDPSVLLRGREVEQ